MSTASRVATLDLGSHTAKLLVAERRDDGSLHEVSLATLTTGFGRDLESCSKITTQTWDRVRAQLDGWITDLREQGIFDLRAVGTEALRRAADTEEHLEQWRRSLGLRVDVISGTREAELATRAMAWDGDLPAMCVLANLGGASTELVAIPSCASESLGMGAATFTERYQPDVSSDARDRLAAEVRDILARSPLVREANHRDLVAQGGTAHFLAAFDRRNLAGAAHQTHGHTFDSQSLKDCLTTLEAWTPRQRIDDGGLPPDRAEVLLAGALILRELMRALGSRTLTVSRRGLVHGLAFEALGNA